MPIVTKLAPFLLVASVAVTGCGSSATETSSNASTPATTAEASATGSSVPGSTPSSSAKVSANDASAAEITVALTAAGVENGDAWADEVMEYRPYPADDPNLTKLREELAKYNPPAGLIDQIVSALEP
jgi:hypothetical protein